ncbi:MAG: 4-hydroxybenzoate octaprenyltransferase [Nitrospira sp.]|nr:4-hydroxybenzoate octaprenyltransferase [Nitrospira sp.]
MVPVPSPEIRPSPMCQGGQTNWQPLADLIRLRNQSGTLLLLWPTLWSLVLASEGHPSRTLLAVFVVGSFLMRSAGVVLNDLADRSFDRQVARTKTRPLASGALSMQASLVTAFLLLSASAGLLYFLNRLTILLSPMAFLLAVLYPFSKRFVQIPQAVLGIAFGWGAVMAWAAVRNHLDFPVWFLYAGTICWALGYDTIYALQDRDDDERIGVKSSAIYFGPRTWLAVACFFAGTLLMLGAAGWLTGLGPAFFVMLAWAGWTMSRQVRLLRGAVSQPVAFALFTQHVWIGGSILAGVWAGVLFP